ncbi:MAG TPA: exopolysaccharide biosynthesis polyprenyl glycosylphosphotransferase [Vicinamibacterales bacterium]|nr:exopolysaccharide biosynthesis polyprenyl glycosylphosphotransferase [Vicinamibacterales bacterium]
MVYKLSHAIDLAPLVAVVSWQFIYPTGELRLVSWVMATMAVVVLVRFVALEIRSKAERVLILGSGPLASNLIEDIESARIRRYAVVGTVDDERPDAESPAGARWLGPCDRFSEIVEQVHPARIVVAVADRRDRLPLQSLLESRVRGIVVEDALEFSERLTGKIAIEALRPSMLFLAKGFRNHGAAEMTARLVSVITAAIGLLLCWPLLAAIAVLVKLDSRGPIFFIQERAGRNGRPFGLIKFRTMHPCAEHQSEWVLDNMHRITRAGRYLRRFRLDELPQLLNVLRGEMNLIGPRPHPTSNHEIFMERIAYYGLRSTVRPGVTGWAQVRHGYANNLDEETEKMRYDLYYIKNRSVLLDVRILIETIGIVLFGKGVTEVRPRRTVSRTGKPWSAAPTPHDEAVAYVPCLAGSTTTQRTASQP